MTDAEEDLGLEVRQVRSGTLIRWKGGTARRVRRAVVLIVVGLVLAAFPFVLNAALGPTWEGEAQLLLGLHAIVLMLGMLGMFVGAGMVIFGVWRLVRGGQAGTRFIKYDDAGLFIAGNRVAWASVGGLHLMDGGVMVTASPSDGGDRPVHELYAGRSPVAEELTWAQGQEVMRVIQAEQARSSGGHGSMQVGGSGPTGVDTVSESSGLDAVELTWKGRGSLRLVLALALGALGWPAFRLGLSGVLGVITQQVPAEDLLFDAPALAFGAVFFGVALIAGVASLVSNKHQVRISRAGVRFDRTTTDWSEVGEVQVADEAESASLARPANLLVRIENAILGVVSQPHLRRTWQVVSVGVRDVRPLAHNLSRDEAERVAEAIARFRPAQIGERDREAEEAILGMREVEREEVG